MENTALRLREALRLTQDEFAKALGLSRSAWSEVENGRRKLQDRHIKLILSAFPSVSEEWLRDGKGEMFRKEEDGPYLDAAEAQKMFDLLRDSYEALPRKAQIEVNRFLLTIAKSVIEANGGSVDLSGGRAEKEKTSSTIEEMHERTRLANAMAEEILREMDPEAGSGALPNGDESTG
ncbi:MAG: helix-turn-helix transcriptional regulator [Succinivibrionaceae bacterium]|nr:helix-turn-helix transcriptional regulator [Succinivibrionaceae bacterium]